MTRTAFTRFEGVPIDRLLLDTGNPRIRAGNDQPDCIERLLRKPKQMLALARDIAANGLSTAPILVQPVKGKKYIVWDGNRRVTALKLLNDPSLCRNKALSAQFAGVAKKAVVPIPGKLDVLGSEDTSALLKEVLARHAGAMEGAGQLNWDALLRTMFLLGHKAAPKEYRLAGLLLLWAEEHGIAVDEDFPITTVHRFLNKQNLERLGFKDLTDSVAPAVEQDAAVRVVERIVQDFGTGAMSVDNVFTAAQQADYIDTVLLGAGLSKPKAADHAADADGTAARAGRTARSSDGSTSNTTDDRSDGGRGGRGRSSATGGTTKRTSRKADWDRTGLVRPRFKPEIPEAHWKTEEILKELRRTVTQRFPFATAALFRMFLELSTHAYMKRHRLPQKQGELHRNALVVAAHMRQYGRLDQGELEASTRRFKDKAQSSLGLQYATLNDYMHSFKHVPDRESLHVLWSDVEPYLEACWDDARRPE